MLSSTTVQRATRAAAAGVVALLLAACGGGGDDTSAAGPPPAGNVGPAGATIASADNNATLSVPAGALSSTINVTLTPTADGFQADPQIVPGTVYRLDAPTTALALPATLSIAVPASAFAAAASSRERVEALIQPKGFLGCYLESFSQGQGYSFFPVPNQPGTDLPPSTTTDPNADKIVCAYDNDLWANGVGCPPGWVPEQSGIWHLPGYFTPQNPSTFPQGSDSGDGRVNTCSVAPVPQPMLASLLLGAKAAILASKFDNLAKKLTTDFLVISPGLFGALFDKTPPVVHLTSIVTPLGNGQATIKLTADATDNTGVTQVTFKQSLLSLNPISGVVSVTSTPLAQFAAPPYTWQSAPMPLDQVYNFFYVARAFDAAGNVGTDINLVTQGAPVISSFTATPPAVAFNGGTATLTWSVSNANTVSITNGSDNSVTDVTGQTSIPFPVSSPTTFTLTASNTSGAPVSQSVTVGVLPEPAPTITSFTATPPTLPVGGGPVTLAWTTTNADTLSISGIGPVTGTSISVNPVVTTVYTLTAGNGANPAVTKTTTVIVASSGDRFVDVGSGSDANNCSQAAPCKTIAKAMNGAPPGSNVYLADGTYGSVTQGGATIPDGVSLRASNAGAAILTNVPLTVAGSANIQGIVLDQENHACARISAISAAGTPALTLSGVRLNCGGALTVGGNVVATMAPGALANGLYTGAFDLGSGPLIALSGAARLTISGGIVDLGNVISANGVIMASGSSSLTLNGVILRNVRGPAIRLLGSAAADLESQTLLDNVGCACTGSAIIIFEANSLKMNGSQISNVVGAAAIEVRTIGTPATLNLASSTITNAAIAISSAGGLSLAAITLDTVSITNNTLYGIQWTDAGGSTIDIKNSIFTGNGTALQLDAHGGASIKLRTSTVSNNTVNGLRVFNTWSAVDLGTAADPGGNTFKNTVPGLTDNVVSGQTVQAVGNTWNPNVQGADAAGHYSNGAVLGPASGGNFSIANASTLNL